MFKAIRENSHKILQKKEQIPKNTHKGNPKRRNLKIIEKYIKYSYCIIKRGS